MARKPRRVSKETIKAKADKAAKRSAGEEIVEPVKPIDPPIIKAAEIKATIIPPKKRRRGRPTQYTPALGKAICKMLSSGMTLIDVCRRDAMPHESVVRWWAAQPEHPFSTQYVRARQIGYMHMGDEIVDIADNAKNDWMERLGEDGKEIVVLNREAIARSQLRIETRKWLLSKALPKIFGDKVALEHTGKDGGPIAHTVAPQPTGDDHLEDITKRYALKTVELLAPKPNGHLNNKANGTKH